MWKIVCLRWSLILGSDDHKQEFHLHECPLGQSKTRWDKVRLFLVQDCTTNGKAPGPPTLRFKCSKSAPRVSPLQHCVQRMWVAWSNCGLCCPLTLSGAGVWEEGWSGRQWGKIMVCSEESLLSQVVMVILWPRVTHQGSLLWDFWCELIYEFVFFFLKHFNLINLFGCIGSSLWHSGSLAVAWELLVPAYGIYFPDQGLNPGPLHSVHGVIATGHQGLISSHYSYPCIQT